MQKMIRDEAAAWDVSLFDILYIYVDVEDGFGRFLSFSAGKDPLMP